MGPPPDSEGEGGWQSNWQRPQEGEWKQAPDGTWYKEPASGSPPPAASQPASSQWAPPASAQPQPQAQWPPPQGGAGGYVVPSGGSSGKAIASLILGIGGLVFCPLICSVLALVLGYQARAEIDRSGGLTGGRGQATAGIVLGWIGIVICVAFIGLVIIGLSVGDSGTTTNFEVN